MPDPTPWIDRLSHLAANPQQWELVVQHAGPSTVRNIKRTGLEVRATELKPRGAYPRYDVEVRWGSGPQQQKPYARVGDRLTLLEGRVAALEAALSATPPAAPPQPVQRQKGITLDKRTGAYRVQLYVKGYGSVHVTSVYDKKLAERLAAFLHARENALPDTEDPDQDPEFQALLNTAFERLRSKIGLDFS